MRYFVLACILALGIPVLLSAQSFDSNGVMVLEAESFKLTNAEVVSDAKASGGKAVKMLDEDAVATLDVTLDAGKYQMTVTEFAPDGDHDAFHIGVGEKWLRVFPDEWGVWKTPEKVLDFEVTSKGPQTIVFRVNWPKVRKKGEDGMLIDKLMIKKM